MSDETTQYVKVEQHDKRIWFGITPNTFWKVLWIFGFFWVGGGKEMILTAPADKPATKGDIQVVQHELDIVERNQKDADRKLSYLFGHSGMNYDSVTSGGSRFNN